MEDFKERFGVKINKPSQSLVLPGDVSILRPLYDSQDCIQKFSRDNAETTQRKIADESDRKSMDSAALYLPTIPQRSSTALLSSIAETSLKSAQPSTKLPSASQSSSLITENSALVNTTPDTCSGATKSQSLPCAKLISQNSSSSETDPPFQLDDGLTQKQVSCSVPYSSSPYNSSDIASSQVNSNFYIGDVSNTESLISKNMSKTDEFNEATNVSSSLGNITDTEETSVSNSVEKNSNIRESSRSSYLHGIEDRSVFISASSDISYYSTRKLRSVPSTEVRAIR